MSGSTRQEEEELTGAQLGELCAQLDALELEVRAGQAQLHEQERPVALDQTSVGRVSRIDAIQQQNMAMEQRRRGAQRLQQIEAARARFTDETYGFCSRCEEPIGFRRLKIRPESPLCITCLNELDKR